MKNGYSTDSELRELLRKRMNGRTLTAISKEIGCSLTFVANVLGGFAPPTGKILAYLGYEKVRTRFYKKVKT